MPFGSSLAGSARVVLGVDTREFNRDMVGAERQFTRSTGNMDRSMGQLTRGVVSGTGAFKGFSRAVAFASVSFLGAAGFTALIRQSVTAASDLNESINKNAATFKASAPEIRAWAENAAHALGMSEQAALENAASVGAMLIPMRFARDNAAAMSKSMVTLASDMASFNNQDPTEMLDRIRAGLAGETEPLRRFGVDLRVASVNAYALDAGIIKQGQSLSAQGQVWARYQLLLQQTKDQQGDFGRTAGGAANQQRTLRASIQEAEAALGKAFIPTLQKLLPQLTGWADELAKNKDLQKSLADGVTDAAGAIGDMARLANNLADALGGWRNELELIFALGVATKIRGMTTAFTALAGTEATVAAAGGAGAAAGIGGAAGRSAVLLRYLRALSLIGVITIGVEMAVNWKGTKHALQRFDAWLKDKTGGPLFDPGSIAEGIAGTGAQPSGAGAIDALTSGSQGPADFGTASGVVATGKKLGPGSGAVYVWGGETIQTGYDCSGFIYDVYKRNGVAIPRDSRSQWNDPNAIHVAPGQELPGDAVYFVGSLGGVNSGPPPGHVGLYIGDGMFIQYFSSGKPAKTSALSSRNDYMGARRWLKIVKSPGASTTSSDVTAPDDLVAAEKKKAKKKAAKTEDPILAGLYLRLAQSEDTKRLTDDLKALENLNVYLTKKINLEKKASEKTKLIKERQQVRGDIIDVQTAIRDAKPLPPPVRIPGLEAVLGAAANLGAATRDLGGGLGKVLQPHALQPTAQMWTNMIGKLKKKLAAALGRRRALVSALKRLGRIKGKLRDPRMIQWHQQQIASLDATIADIRSAIGEAMAARADIVAEAASKAQDAADEAERVAIEEGTAATEAFERGLIETPADARLAMAVAEGTPGTADDLALLRKEEARLEGNRGVSGDIETEIQIVNALNGVRAQMARLIEEAKTTAEATVTLVDIEQNRLGFLQGLRALRSDQSNLFDPLAELRGSTINVSNFFQSSPEAHLWSKDLEFELKALVA